MKLESKPVVSFNDEEGPEQGPKAADVSYAERVKQKKLDRVKGKGLPLGGAPPIPEGKLSPLIPSPLRQPDFEEPPPDIGNPPQQMIQGMGSAYEVNQAISRGDLKKPITLREANNMGMGRVKAQQGLSEETVKALEMAKEHSENSKFEAADKEIVEEAQESNQAKAPEIPFNLDEMFRNQNLLMNEPRRKSIEERLQPLHIEDLIVNRELVQVVDVIPNKFNVTLRTFSQREHIWILNYLYEFPGSQRYSDELLNTFKLVLSVVAVNGARLPDHRAKIGTSAEEVDRDAFKKKMYHVASFPVQLIADMGVQCNWFNERVNKLFTFENVKNG